MARAVLVLTVVLYARALEITLNLGEDDPEARLSFSATDDLPARAMEFASERGLVAGAARVVEDAMRRRVHRTRAFSLAAARSSSRLRRRRCVVVCAACVRGQEDGDGDPSNKPATSASGTTDFEAPESAPAPRAAGNWGF